MKFLDVIIENSPEKIAKLYKPAFKAYENPENGITIQNKSAYHVIKDCAGITKDYLPLLVFGLYKNPFQDLKGKFKKKDIEEFVVLAVNTQENNINIKQLLNYIKSRVQSQEEVIHHEPVEQKHLNMDDPYGDYGMSHDIPSKKTHTPNDIDLLCSAFNVSN